MASDFRKTKVELDLLTYINTLLMIEKAIRGGICHHAKVNSKYVQDYHKNKESVHLSYRDLNNAIKVVCYKSCL